MNSDINWQEIVDEVFYNNSVKCDPSKFLNAFFSMPATDMLPGLDSSSFTMK